MMNDREIVEVIQAKIDGKPIQETHNDGKWYPFSGSWAFDCRNYRVKQEPREWWLVSQPMPGVDKLLAYEVRQKGFDNIHVREVIE